MTDTNPYDFLSEGEAPSLNGSSQETFSAPQAVAEREIETTIEGDSDFSDSPYSALDADEPTNGVHSDLTTHAPQGAVPREDSLAALAAQEAHRVAHDSNGFTDEMAIESHTNGRADYESSYDHLSDSEAITAYESAPELAPLSDGGEPPKPPSDSERAILQPQEPIGPNERPHDDEMDIWSHLGELRSRMLKAILAVVVTSSLAWNFVGPIQDLLLAPVLKILKQHGIKEGRSRWNWDYCHRSHAGVHDLFSIGCCRRHHRGGADCIVANVALYRTGAHTQRKTLLYIVSAVFYFAFFLGLRFGLLHIAVVFQFLFGVRAARRNSVVDLYQRCDITWQNATGIRRLFSSAGRHNFSQ